MIRERWCYAERFQPLQRGGGFSEFSGTCQNFVAGSGENFSFFAKSNEFDSKILRFARKSRNQ
jgi:hypothetical protein